MIGIAGLRGIFKAGGSAMWASAEEIVRRVKSKKAGIIFGILPLLKRNIHEDPKNTMHGNIYFNYFKIRRLNLDYFG